MTDTLADTTTYEEAEWTAPDPSAFEEDHFPARAGDWIAQGETMVRVVQIKRIYDDHLNGTREFLADLILFDLKGNKIGRESPVEGGPRTFEPACSLVGWQRIEKPDFPIKMVWENRGDGLQRIFLRSIEKKSCLHPTTAIYTPEQRELRD